LRDLIEAEAFLRLAVEIAVGEVAARCRSRHERFGQHIAMPQVRHGERTVCTVQRICAARIRLAALEQRQHVAP
jgi:hypothetical protein